MIRKIIYFEYGNMNGAKFEIACIIIFLRENFHDLLLEMRCVCTEMTLRDPDRRVSYPPWLIDQI